MQKYEVDESTVVDKDKEMYLEWAKATLNRGHSMNTSYMVTFKNTSSYEPFYTSAACHGALGRSFSPTKKAATDRIYTAGYSPYIFSQETGKLANTFFDWMLDPEISPWRKTVLPHAEVHRYKSGEVATVSFDMDKVPVKPAFNFFWAMRMPARYPTALKLLNMLIADGVHPTVAVQVSSKYYFAESEKKMLFYSTYDHWLQVNNLSLDRMLKGEPKANMKERWATHSYAPNVAQWFGANEVQAALDKSAANSSYVGFFKPKTKTHLPSFKFTTVGTPYDKAVPHLIDLTKE